MNITKDGKCLIVSFKNTCDKCERRNECELTQEQREQSLAEYAKVQFEVDFQIAADRMMTGDIANEQEYVEFMKKRWADAPEMVDEFTRVFEARYREGLSFKEIK